MDITTRVKLNNGVEMPVFGFGTYLIEPGIDTYNAVTWAIEAGYRLIDTAAFYNNEDDVGRAVQDSSLTREEFFITTKLRNDDQGYDKAIKAFNTSMKKLELEYIDLYLIHWPVTGLRNESWKALEHILSEGLVRAIGVSNYTIGHLKTLLITSDTVPAVNQVEFHPYLFQKELLDFCSSKGIWLEAYCPLVRGRMLNDPRLGEIAFRYKKTPAQILIRWSLQHGNIVIPKSVHQERIMENSNVFDFNLSEEDMNLLNSFNENYRVAWDPNEIK